MKKGFKKRLLTGITAAALIAPLILSGSGMSHAYAASEVVNPPMTKATGNNSNSSQLAAIKAQIQAQENSMQTTIQQYRQRYKNIPKNQRNQQKALLAQYSKQEKPAQEKLAALQKKYTRTMTPKQRKQAQDQQKAAQKKIMQQLQKQMKSQQKKERAQMLKTAQSLFMIKGHTVYMIKADVSKKGSAMPVPGTMRKVMPLKRFANLQRREVMKSRLMAQRAQQTRNSREMKHAQALFMRYARVLQMPTKKQQGAEAKQAAEMRKRKKTGSRRLVRHKRNHRRTHRHAVRRVHHRAGTFSINEGGRRIILLRSEFKHGNRRALKRSGFSNGRTLDRNTYTMFSKYLPNDRRAVVPYHYKIHKVNLNSKNDNMPATVWLVGHRTNNINKINNMKQAYYYGYNKRYGGWRNIGR